MDVMDEREAKLPLWARETIANLRRQLQIKPDTQDTINKLRLQLELMKAKNEAMTELIECAARGGHKQSVEIMDIIGNYDLTLTKHDEE